MAILAAAEVHLLSLHVFPAFCDHLGEDANPSGPTTGKEHTYKILASLFRRSKKKPIWTPKTINEVARAVKKATRLIPLDD